MHGTRTAESGIVTLVSFPTSAFQLSTMSNYVNQWFLSWFCVYITVVNIVIIIEDDILANDVELLCIWC